MISTAATGAIRQCAAFRRRSLPWMLNSTAYRGYEILIDPSTLLGKKKPKRKHDTSRKPSYRFVDKTRVRVAGGSGGKGSLSQQMLRRKHKLRPDGGHGGDGGSVILVADAREQSLKWSQPHVQAEKGSNGSSKEKLGRNGKNLILRVPCGVIVRRVITPDNNDWDNHSQDDDGSNASWNDTEDNATTEIDYSQWNIDRSSNNNQGVEFFVMDDENDMMLNDNWDSDNDITEGNKDGVPSSSTTSHRRQTVYLADLDKPGAHILVAKGGRGGLGTMVHAGTHGPLPDARVLVEQAQPEPGEVAFLELELKLIADVGLVGFPNAGKSSILRAMSRATPEVAPYPFTTLHPLMGVIEYRDGMQVKVADIPGLIAGASQGRGKGIDFLRHVERTKALCYVLDVAGTEGRNPHEDLRVLVDELSAYAEGTLLDRDALVVANKVDLIEPESLPELLASIQETADSLGIERWNPVAGISAGVSGQGLASFSKDIRGIVEQYEETVDENAY